MVVRATMLAYGKDAPFRPDHRTAVGAVEFCKGDKLGLDLESVE